MAKRLIQTNSKSFKKKSYKRKFNVGLIEIHSSYYVSDLVDLFNVAENTIRAWIKAGLKTIDNKTPIMIYGADLKEFLNNKQKKKDRKCQNDEMSCFKCKSPQKILNNKAELTFLKDKTFHLKGKCQGCNSTMNRIYSLSKMEEMEKILTIL